MKKIFATICAFLIALTMNAQMGWTEDNLIYCNTYYGFKWQFPAKTKWIESPSEASHTVFKAIGNKGDGMAMVSFVGDIQNMSGSDIWEYGDMIQKYIRSIAEESTVPGIKETIVNNTMQAEYCGVHALKYSTTTFVFNKSGKKPIITTETTTYIFLKNGQCYQVSFSASTKKFKKMAEDVIRGFSFDL